MIFQDLGVLGQFYNLIIGKNCRLLLLGRDLYRDRFWVLGSLMIMISLDAMYLLVIFLVFLSTT